MVGKYCLISNIFFDTFSDETLDPVNERGVVPVLIESIGDPDMSMTVVIGCVQSCAVHGKC